MSAKDRKKPIGVFDSGIGGLTVLKQIMRLLPNENTIYLGDTARVPYGTKSQETVKKYSFQNIHFLLEKGVKLLVIACNTATAYSLDTARETFKIPIIGVIEPGAMAAVRESSIKRVGVIGTRGTIESSVYRKAIMSLNPEFSVFEKPCPLFVSLAEEGLIHDNITFMIADKYLASFKSKRIDTLVLGCTHYPLLKNIIQKSMGKSVNLIDSSIETAKVVKDILKKNTLENKVATKPYHRFFVTDTSSHFLKTAKLFLGKEIEHFVQVDL
ncbi:MAG: glutamate racemase [Candidatus Schekmanbacteria bacterium RIFCSPHIGHO2_02_FULL_38_11]|uniref:Glutamate racemase n=1 Tax=Candidatus Schekmanbacteria bacterium RIFCSPLOWO2_12_FULL_38_15 TaxID=1817883 RepID=A0A1F7SJF6_9BACT|nr:MAG: glutamate racemase [Candidatus Schekmanbacteria bacterium GWA2_38_9]OGL48081.1 MAG: glutamate racemase [Candidatus Schekmanbacteria bacterium RIFCSPHIGHO2_02_FULL_38_11]OGL50440.1 MAG: glutamate racemase [Candidatus Schekmanbacteria bacterium RIFCSPLOWO2_02_FULL_38_14]OGL53899.1 MAG: glutamate racemase [Candidatus Schekmanbacteria bacterium RIFCSPLOWO2_12_FULL_38_15]